MERTGIFSGTDDRRIGESPRLASDKFMKIFGLQFPLPNSGLKKFKNPAESRLRDIDCLLKKFDLLWIFDHAKLLQRHRHPLIIVQWIKLLTPANKATITSFYNL